MKGYYVPGGFCGWVDGRYMLFSSESEYYELAEAEPEDEAA